MIKKIFLILALTGLSFTYLYGSQGRNSFNDYMWTNSAGDTTVPYNWIDALDGTVVFGSPVNSNIISTAQTLPFIFNYYGDPKTEIYISANGYITFEDPGTTIDIFSDNVQLDNISAPDSSIFAYWGELTSVGSSAGVYVKTIGTTPNRKYIIQWALPNFSGIYEFQIILYETTNLIKIQHARLTLGTPGAGRTVGLKATGTEYMEYTFEDNPVTLASYAGILFHNKGLNSADASILPVTAEVNTSQSFTYTVNNIVSDANYLSKADSLAITIPGIFSNPPTVTQVDINGNSVFIQNSANKPDERGFATWNYNAGILSIQTPHFDVMNDISVSYILQTPTTPSTNNDFSSEIGAILDTIPGMTATTDQGYGVDVVPGSIPSYYTFNPSTSQNIVAGDAGVAYVITAYDQFDNAISSNDSVLFTASGSASAVFSLNNTLGFGGGSTVNVTVTDTQTGSFTVLARRYVNDAIDGSVTGTSGLITVTSAGASTLTETSSAADIRAGSERRLEVRVTDAFGNNVSGATVAFTIGSGSGSFSSNPSPTSNVNGLAYVDYTASETSGGTDVINVNTTGAPQIQISLDVIPDIISYYSFVPNTDASVVAGEQIQFTITARDQYGNAVDNNGQVNLSGQGSSTEIFSPGPYQFAGGSTIIFNVSDTRTGSFTVVAANTLNSNINGQSATITIIPADASQFSILSSQADIIAGTGRILSVALEDQYGNRKGADSTVIFTRLNPGTGLFSNGLSAISVPTVFNGTASATYTASSVSGLNDSIQVNYNSTVLDTILLPVINGTLAELRIQTVAGAGGAVLTNTTLSAGQTLPVYAEGYDAQGNYTGPVSADWSGTGVVTGNITPGPFTNAVFTAAAAGTGSIIAVDNSGGIIDDESGIITVTPGTTNLIVIMDAANNNGNPIDIVNLSAGEVLNLFANGFDSEGNFSGNIPVDWATSGTLLNSDLSSPTASSSTTFVPSNAGTGTIFTTSSYTDDATGIITSVGGTLSRLQIRTGPNNAGIVLEDSIVSAGNTISLFAAGYDLYGNYIGDQVVRWSIEQVNGDSIGYFSSIIFSDNNSFNATTVNSGRLRIDSLGLALNDFSGIIKVRNGSPATLTASSDTFFTGNAGSFVSDSLQVVLRDGFGNFVPDSLITWSTPTDGFLNPAADITNTLGASHTKWQLRSSSVAGYDTAYASFGALPPVLFRANVNPSDADIIIELSGDGQNSAVATTLSAPFFVRVEDNNNNPVPNISITFYFASIPIGAEGYSLSTTTIVTDASGLAQTTLTLGDLVGNYVVRASNAGLTGSPVTFTANAFAGPASQLLAYSGNQQSGTVGSVLTNNIYVRANDQYGNRVSGQAITWLSSSDGVFNSLGTDITTINGIDSVSWNLRTEAGPDSLYAILPGLDTTLYTATANADAPANILQVSGHLTSTIAGGNQRIEARIIDQYGNSVPGASGISFVPLNRMSAFNTVSDADGLVSAIYRTPAGLDSSTAQAILSVPFAAADFRIYGIQYVSNSLFPETATTGDTVNFYLQVRNPGINPVQIDTSQSTFAISYNNITESVTVDSPLVLTANSITDLKFKPLIVDEIFPSGAYTPLITIVGDGPDATINGNFNTNPGELSISPLEITRIVIPGPEDTLNIIRGSVIPNIQMTVRNRSSNTLDTFNPDLNFNPDDGYFETLIGGPVTIAPGGTGTFSFSLNIPANAVAGIKEIDGSITAEFQGTNIQVEDFASAVTDIFNVIDAVDLNWLSYSPDQITDGQNVTFSALVRNDGPFDLVLDRDNTSISFAANTFNLSSNNVIEGNGLTSNLVFNAGNLTVADDTPAILQISGTEQGNNFVSTFSSDTITGISNLTVQIAADLAIDALTLSATEVSQGQNGETLTLNISNNGQATAVINALDNISLFVNGTDITLNPDYQLSFISGQTFPLNLSGAANEVIIFSIDVDSDADTAGIDIFSAQVAFTDSNSLAVNNVLSAINPSWSVLAKSNLQVTSINAVPTLVTQGQAGLNVSVTIFNSGEVTALVDDVVLEFQRNENFQTVTLPDSIQGGNSTIITFTVTIDPNAATGLDSIRAIVSGSNLVTSEPINYTSDYLDFWTVFSSSRITINAVSSTYRNVNRGQQNVPVIVTVSNDGQSTVIIDSLVLNNLPDNSTADSRITAIDSIEANETINYVFNSDILGTAADTVILGASFYGTNVISGTTVTDFNPASSDTLFVGDQPVLQIDSVFASFDTFTQGQTNLDVRISVSNMGTSNIDLDSVRLDISSAQIGNPDAGNSLSYTQITPVEANLPTLLGGTSTTVLFRLTSSLIPADSGLVRLDARAYGFDVLSLAPQADLSAGTQADTVLLQTPAVMFLDSTVAILDSVSQGTINPITLYVTNNGQSTLRINSFTSAEYGLLGSVSPALPFNVTGGAQVSFTGSVNVSASTATGDVGLDYSAAGQDAVTGAVANDAGASVFDSWYVVSAPDIVVSNISSTWTLVTQNQTNIPVNVTIRNDGGTPVNITNIRLNPTIGLYTQTWPPFNFRLNGNDSITVQVLLDVLFNSATGLDQLFATVQYQNLYSAAAGQITGSEFYSWTIGNNPDIRILSVQTQPVNVSQGQSGINVQVRVRNAGGNNASIQTMNLVFENGAANYLVGPASPALPNVLNPGLERIFTFPVTVNGSSLTGIDTISASLSYLSSGTLLNSADTTIYDTWNVQIPPALIIDSVSVNRSVASTGQTGLTASVYVHNTANPAGASVQIDSVNLLIDQLSINRNDQFSINQNSTPNLPLILPQGARSRFDFGINVNSDALSGLYNIDAEVGSQDVNSGTASLIPSSVQTAPIVIEEAAFVVVDTLWAVPDSISQGQTHGRIYVQITNTGEASAEMTGSGLSFVPSLTDLQPTYLEPARPFAIAGGATDTMVYAFVASQSYSGLVNVNSQITGRDSNTGLIFNNSSSSPTQFLIQTRAAISWLNTSPLSTPGNTNVQFTIDVTNSGNADIQLNNNTTINLGGFNIPLSNTSAQVIAPSGATTTLIFRDTLITGLIPNRNYPLLLNIRGLENEASFTQEISAGSIGYGDNLLTVTSILIQGTDIRFQGDTGIEVDLNIANSAGVFTIDSVGTYLFLEEIATGNPISILNLRRTDNLSTITADTALTFQFDLPITAPTGPAHIYGRLSLDGGAVVIETDTLSVFDVLNIQSAAQINFVAGSALPDTVVRNQQVSFQLNFENTQSASLSLISDSSYIEFSGFNTVVRRNIAGNYTVNGNGTSSILFNPIIIPATQPLAEYNLDWHLSGTMLNGDTYSNSGIVFNAFEIVQSAQLVFSNIDIEAPLARRNEEGVRINFTIANTGSSDAIITGINYGFTNNGNPVNNDFIATTTGLFPDTLSAGLSTVYNVNFNIASDADTGIVIPAPTVNFRDIKVPNAPLNSALIGTNDQIDIVIPASVRVDSLYFSASGMTPNAPIVNLGQSFILEVGISNSGDVGLANGIAILSTGGVNVDTVNIINLAAGGYVAIPFNSIISFSTGSPRYTVRLDQLVDNDGFSLLGGQALDNSETIIVQQQTTLSISNAEITAPEAALDSTVTQNQQFTVRAVLNRNGQSAFGNGSLSMTLPANYSFAGSSTADYIINEQILTATWTLRADAFSVDPFDTLNIAINNIPVDQNTGENVSLAVSQQVVLVRTLPSGAITVASIAKTAPFGNRDTISTSQQFVVEATVIVNKELGDTTAVLNLPSAAGYSILGASSQSAASGVVSWIVAAPANVISNQSNFNVTVSGLDLDNGTRINASSANLTLNLQSKANISIATVVVNPPGALDRIVSTGQEVIIRTTVSNSGEAGFDNSGILRLEAFNGAQFRNNDSLVNSLSRTNITSVSYLDTLVIPAVSGQVNIISKILPNELPIDINSNLASSTGVDSVYRDFQVENRANLRLRISKTGAVNNLIVKATSQVFQIKALVTNNGAVGIDTTGGRHYIVLDTVGTGLTILNGESLRKSFSLDSLIVWNVQNKPMEDTIMVRVHLDDSVYPVDQNDNQNAFRTALAKQDSLRIDLIQVSELLVESSYSANEILKTLIVGQNQDSIYIEATASFDPLLFDSKTITLILPENSGYSLMEGSLIKNISSDQLQPTVSWLIKAPQQSRPVENIIITAYSQNPDTTLSQQESDTLTISTIAQSRLTLLLSIDLPDGAADGVVSQGQAFRLRGVVNNRIGSNVNGSGTVQVNADAQYFSLIDSSELGIDASFERNFSVGQPFYWWIQANGVTPESSISTLNYYNEKIGNQKKQIQISSERKSVPGGNALKELKWAMARINQLFAGVDIDVEITEVPNDAILNSPAEVEENIVSKSVIIVPEARITIDSVYVQPTVSTGQVFHFTVWPDEITSNLQAPLAGFILPQIFGGDTSYVPVSDSASISLNVPQNYSGNGTESLGVFLIGTDQNTNTLSVPSATITRNFTVQLRPDIILKSEILKPLSAIDRAVSFGQEIQIRVWAELAPETSILDYADVLGNGEITLNNLALSRDNFKLSDGQNLSQPFNFDQLGEENAFLWKIKAPLKELTTSLNFTFSQFLIDANSGLSVVSSKPGESVAIRVRPKEIIISRVDTLITSTSFVQGDQDLPLLAFEVSNKGLTDSLYVNALQVSFLQNNDNLLGIDALVNMFGRLKVVNYDYLFSGLAKNSDVTQPLTYANVVPSATDDNPFSIIFENEVQIQPDTTEILLVLADFNENATSRSFRTRLNDVTVFDVSDTIRLVLKDSEGNDWSSSPNNTSEVISLTPNDPDKSFFTYPNPFGRGSDDEKLAKFHFYLEETSNVTVRVFTLLGEMVWSDSRGPVGPGNWPRLIQWDGRNTNGKRVLNGAYIGTIEIKPLNGGSAKRYLTKIAYIK